MRKILMLITTLFLWCVFSTAQADIEATITLDGSYCEASLFMAQYARTAAIAGTRSEEIAYVTANFSGEQRDFSLKLLRWGFAFYSSSEDQLTNAFMKSCGGDPTTMPEVDER